MKRMKMVLLIALCVLAMAAVVIAGQTWNNRERLKSAPMQIDYRSGDTPWALQIKDSSGVRRLEFRHDGAMVVYDSSGVTRNYTDGSGNQILYNASGGVVATDYTSGTTALLSGTTGTIPLDTSGTTIGWTLTTANMQRYKTFWVDTHAIGVSPYTNQCPSGIAASGVTVVLTGTLTKAIDGMAWTFINVSGTTAFVLYDANGRFNGGSGTTETAAGSAARAPEDNGDSVTIQAFVYPSGVSGWRVINIWTND